MEVLMTKYIRVDYSVKPDVDLDELKAAIGEFVAGIRSHHPEHRYTSFQHPADPFRFIHIGEVVEEVLPDLQKQSFFQHFTGYLRERCSAGPEVTRLDRVASTAAQPAAAPHLPASEHVATDGGNLDDVPSAAAGSR